MTVLKVSTTYMDTSTKLTRPLRFVELLGRSNFSFLQGASHPEEMALEAQALGYEGLALCDLNGLYGLVRGWQAIAHPSHFTMHSQNNPNFRFHCGAEMQLVDKSSIVLLPMNKEGYFNLCQLITSSKRESEKTFSNFNLESLVPFSDDLIALALPSWTKQNLMRLKDIFLDRLYIPIWKDLTWQSLDLYQQALQLEKNLNIPLVATNRPFMHERGRKPLHDVLTCIFHKTTLQEAKTRLTSNSERFLKPLEDLISLWRDRPDLLTRTVEIAARLNFSLTELQYEYPEAARPVGVEASDYLRQLVEIGLKKRFPQGVPQNVYKIVEHELNMIQELRYEDYFLTLWDVCQFAERRGILHQGRGSAANSIVCYALGLTAVNPKEVTLIFERFISKERGEPPDIDIDFASDRREEVIQYIYEKYGSEHAAMVCTVICYRSRMALRECAKVLKIPLPAVDKMVRFMGREGLTRLKSSPELAAQWNLTPHQFNLLMRMTEALKGFPRHLGIHTGGFLIAKRPITECVPVEKATMDKRYVVQWNKDDLNILKMLKIDVLGLGMLTALGHCFTLLKKYHNKEHDLYNVPANDRSTYEMIQRADTIGVFQIESRAQMSLLPRLKPKCFYDLVVEVAIVRPGPIQGGMVHPYIRRRHGLEKVDYEHPDLIPILQRTFGVPIFQEQIMQIASAVCGFTAGEADELRRIMSSSWKKTDLMHGLRQRLINGMLAHGIKPEYAERVYQTIVGFSSFGFPESHAASFALLTYTSCYLKQHYPEVFTCALLNAQPMGFYSPRMLIGDAQRHNVKFLPIDVQKSDWDYALEKSGKAFAVRAGLRAIRGLKEKQIENLLKARQEKPFASFKDFIQRSHLNRHALFCLAGAGALNHLGLTPREALWQIQRLPLDPQNLFFAHIEKRDSELIPNESEWQRMQREYKTLGHSLTHHPLSVLRPDLERWSQIAKQNNSVPFCKAADLKNKKDRQRIRIAGLLSLYQRPPTAKGFAFLTMEDESGLFNVVLLPHIYEKYRLVAANSPLLQIEGSLQKADEVIHLKAEVITALSVQSELALRGRHSLLQAPSRSL